MNNHFQVGVITKMLTFGNSNHDNSMFLLEPCYKSGYRIQPTKFEKSNIISRYIGQTYRSMLRFEIPPNTETYSLVINFAGSYIDLSEEIQLTNLANFISAVGGNLGLFIGFSVLPLVLKTAEIIWHSHLRRSFISRATK